MTITMHATPQRIPFIMPFGGMLIEELLLYMGGSFLLLRYEAMLSELCVNEADFLVDSGEVVLDALDAAFHFPHHRIA